MDTNFLRLESRIDVLERKIDHVETTLIGVIRRVDDLEKNLFHIQRINYRKLSAIDLIVGKAKLDVEESEIDNHLSKFVKNQSGGQDRLHIKGFLDSVSIGRSETKAADRGL